MAIDAHRYVETPEGNRVKLNDVMAPEHVIRVDADGNVNDEPDVDAPEAYQFEDDPMAATPEGWSLMHGYSSQSGYRGPWMHASEFIGGGMADDILDTPGLYVTIVDEEADAWAVAYKFA